MTSFANDPFGMKYDEILEVWDGIGRDFFKSGMGWDEIFELWDWMGRDFFKSGDRIPRIRKTFYQRTDSRDVK